MTPSAISSLSSNASRDGDSTTTLGNLLQCFDNTFCKEIPPNVQPEPLLTQSEPFSLVLPVFHLGFIESGNRLPVIWHLCTMRWGEIKYLLSSSKHLHQAIPLPFGRKGFSHARNVIYQLLDDFLSPYTLHALIPAWESAFFSMYTSYTKNQTYLPASRSTLATACYIVTTFLQQ